MSLEELRTQIDGIDKKMLELFQQRMEVSKQIAAYKQQHQSAKKQGRNYPPMPMRCIPILWI